MQTRQGSSHCPVCKAGLFSTLEYSASGDVLPVNCPNCGPYELSDSADTVMHAHPAPQDRSRLAYCIRRLPPSTLVTANLIEKMLKSAALPTPMERLDNVILHMAKTEPGTAADLLPLELRATIGTESDEGALWALRQARALDYLEGDESQQGKFKNATLTVKGWQRHAELMRDGAASRHAFMAMKFNDPDLDRVYREHFKPAVEATGFDLRRADEGHKTAGLIDNRMRVEIRTSRFMVCDLSHGNRGAYWEAGFAEGIGRPVIYICREDVLTDSHADRPHFDANHQAIIKWSPASPASAAQQLKDMIRATLPAEAKMED